MCLGPFGTLLGSSINKEFEDPRLKKVLGLAQGTIQRCLETGLMASANGPRRLGLKPLSNRSHWV